MSNGILQYESKIWATADLLRGCGIKESEWPSFMMPFFALIMIESRLLRLYEKEVKEFGGAALFDALPYEDRYGVLIDQKQGYNKYIFEQKKTLKDICANDKAFEIDFDAYLKGFDEETKDLLGVDPGEGEKFLDIKGKITILKSKKVLFGYTKLWSEIDLRPFNNSEITTLEEHIKRKWADISAETAGEQYTPDDVIALIAEIIASKIEETDTLLKIYDCTCGGGNLLFGVEDRISDKVNRLTQTFGQDWNDALYALAKIESRFRPDSKIEHGNTLVEDKFYNEEFEVVTANPPYGVSWKGYESDIRKDKTGRFKYLPSISDGQLLFMQHLISKMAHEGIGVVVHNGSTLFSGDAGSSESNIRKWMLDSDILEALIQLPTDEFFNTGIYTYLWVLNKNKKPHQKDKVMLINASEKFKQLKKSKGAKRKEIDEASRLDIVKTLTEFQDNDYARVFDKEYFYFNKQAILLTNVDVQGKALQKNEKLSPTKLENGERELTEFVITNVTLSRTTGAVLVADASTTGRQSRPSAQREAPSERHDTLADYFEKDIKPFIASLDYKEQPLVITTGEAKYSFDPEQETLVKETEGKRENLGCGRIVVKAAHKNKKQAERIEITVELTPDTEKDYEIVPFCRNETENKAAIDEFMKKYVTKPFEYLDNVMGVEVNFNKVFYKPESLSITTDVLAEITKIDSELRSYTDLRQSLINETVTRGLDKTVPMKDSGVEWIGQTPAHWEVKRVKEVGLIVLGKMLDQVPGEGKFYRSYLKSKNIGWLRIEDANIEQMYFSQNEMKMYRLTKNDILLSEGGEVGKTAFWNDEIDECYIQNSVHKITVSKNNYPRYFLYQSFLLGVNGYYNSIVNHVSIKHLTKEKLSRVVWVRPPLEEQIAIADYLDTQIAHIEKIIETINLKIKKLEELRKTLINDVVTGKIRVTIHE